MREESRHRSELRTPVIDQVLHLRQGKGACERRKQRAAPDKPVAPSSRRGNREKRPSERGEDARCCVRTSFGCTTFHLGASQAKTLA